MTKQNKSHKKFSIKEAVGFAWKIATRKFWFISRILIIAQVIGYAISYLAGTFQESEELSIILLGCLFFIAGWILDVEFTFAKTAIYFKLVDNKKAKVEDLFGYFNPRLLWNSFIIYLLLMLGFILGLLLFVFPGIYFLTKYWFAPYIYVDKRKGVFESFIESAKLTEGIKTKLFLLGLLQMIIVLAGALAFLVGLFIAIPMNTLSDLYIYRKLTAKK